MIQAMLISTGERVLLDIEDYRWASKRKWAMRCVRLSGEINAFVVSKNNSRIPIFHFMNLPFPTKRFRLQFKNGDRLDYRKDNLHIATGTEEPHERRNGASAAVTFVDGRVKPNNGVLRKTKRRKETIPRECYIRLNDCTIERTRSRRDHVLCAICHYLENTRYDRCLTHAAGFDWKGWRPKEGEWCHELLGQIERVQQESECPLTIPRLVLGILELQAG